MTLANDLHVAVRNRIHPTTTLLALALALTCVVYWPGLHGGYLFDDFPNIVDNAAVHVSTPTLENWRAASMASISPELKRPLAMLSFAANHYATGLDPFWMKLTNLVIHLLNGLLLFAVLGKLLRLWLQANPSAQHATLTSRQTDLLAALVASAWLLAPINLTAVLYVVQRMTSLAQVFVLAGMWLYLHGRARQCSGRRGWAWLATGLLGGTLLGLCAKETAILLPVYALACELTLLGFRNAKGQRNRGLMAMFAAIIVVPLLLGTYKLLPGLLHGNYGGRPFTLAQRLLTECRVLVDYLYWTLLPSPQALSFYHDDIVISKDWLTPPSTLACGLLLAGLATAAIASIRTAPLVALGLLWFFAAHLLESTVIPLELVYEHRNYFASIGLLLALFSILLPLTHHATLRRPAYALLLALIAWPVAVSAMRAQEWSHPLRLASSETLRHPLSPRAHYELGRALVIVSDNGHKSPALLDEARQVFLTAMWLPNSSLLPEHGLLLIAGKTGSTADPAWWHSMAEKLAQRPPSAEDRVAIVALLMCQIKGPCPHAPREMLAVFVNALAHPNPDYGLLTSYAQFAAHELGDWELARRVAQEAVSRSGSRSATIREALGPILRSVASTPDGEQTPARLP